MTIQSEIHLPQTCGAWATETDSAAAFDKAIAPLVPDIFSSVHSEVQGYYLASRPGREAKSARIDRVLMAGPELQALNWNAPIGVEIKASNAKLGHPVAQAIDYTWAAFQVYGQWFLLDWIFLWPAERQVGPIESVMSQNRVGTCAPSRAGIKFQAGSGNVITIRNGVVEARAEMLAVGKKRGSR